MALQVIVAILLESRMDWMIGRETTATAKDFVSLRLGDPLSATRTVKPFVVLTRSRPGVQVRMPEDEFIKASAGELVRLKVSRLAGRSESVAEFVMASVLPW